MKVGDLFIQLGIKTDNQQLNKFVDGFKQLRSNLLLTAAAFSGAVYSLDKFVSGTVSAVTSLQNLNQQTGLSIDQLQRWQQAGQLSNLALSADTIAQSIGNLQRNLSAIRMGQGNASPFQLLGIDVNDNAFGVLKQLRENINGIDPSVVTNLIGQMGLDAGFVNILRLSNKEFEQLSRNSFLSKGQRDSIASVGFAIKELTLRFQAFKNQAVAKLAPELNKLIYQFFGWLNKNGSKVIATISSLVTIIGKFASAIANSFDLISRFIERTIGLQNGLKALALTFAAVSLSFSPFILGLTLLILLLDDIDVWMRGGKSLFGGFYEAIAKFSKESGIVDMIKSFKQLSNLEKIIGGAGLILFLTNLTGVFGVLASNVSKVASGLLTIKGGLIGLAAFGAYEAITHPEETKKAASKTWEWIKNKGSDIIDYLNSDEFGYDINNKFLPLFDLSGGTMQGRKDRPRASFSPISNYNNSAAGNNITINNSFNASTSGEQKAAASLITGQIKSNFSAPIIQFNNGGR